MFSVQQYWAAALDRVRALHRRRNERRERHRSAEARGLALLRQWLSDVQRAQFDAHGYFDVIGSDSGARFRIRYGSATNVYELDAAGGAKAGWCFVPIGDIVPGDVMLTQKIALETNELGALTVAKKFLPRGDLLPPT
jgi:hypothetical protein